MISGTPTPARRARLAAIILSGGRATRMGGVTKTALTVAGRSLLARTTDAALAACDGAVVIVGEAPDDVRVDGERTVVVREDPPGGGPVAALSAALPFVDADRVLLLSGDLVAGDAAVTTLVAAGAALDASVGSTSVDSGPSRRSGSAPSGSSGVRAEGAVLVDSGGRTQWLCALVSTRALGDAVARRQAGAPGAGSLHGARMSEVVGALGLTEVPDTAGVSADIDTWQDLSRARSRTSGAHMSDRTLPPEALDEWSSVLRDRFGLDADQVPIGLVLDLARDVAHDVARPAAPLSAFIAGLVAGRAGGSRDDTAAAIAEIVSLAAVWAEGREESGQPADRGPGGGGGGL